MSGDPPAKGSLAGWLRRFLLIVSALALRASLASAQDPDFAGETVVAIRIEGLEFHTEQAILDAMEQKIGQPLDPAAMRRSMTALWDTYKILPAGWTPVKVEGGVQIVMYLQEWPVDFEARLVGNVQVKTKDVLEWAGIGPGGQVNLNEVERIRRRLTEAYKRKGFYHVEVEAVTRDPEGGEEAPADVIFQIREGPKVRCTGVTIKGNESIPDTGTLFWRGGLQKLADVQTKGKGLLHWWGRTFDEEALEADLVALKKVYRDRGYLDVFIEVEDLAFNEQRNRVRVHILVEEGELYSISSVDVRAFVRVGTGPEDVEPADLHFPVEELIARLEARQGVPLEAARVQADHFALRDYYGERGYLEERFFQERRGPDGAPIAPEGFEFLEPVTVVDPETRQVRLIYRIVQGRPRIVRDVTFRGNEHTRDRVLRREVSVKVGEIANVRDIHRSRARLEGTGYFTDRNSPDHPPPRFVLKETDDPDYVDVEYVVIEGRVVDLAVSGGIASDSGLVGILSLSMRNFDAANLPKSFSGMFGEVYRKEAFHGNGEVLMLDLAPGSQISYARIRYRYPDLLGSHYNRWSVDTEVERRERIYSSHDEDTSALTVDFGRVFDFDKVFSVGPVFQQVDVNDLDEDAVLPETLILSEGISDYVGVNAGFRYEQLNNRLSPSSGMFFRTSVTVYGDVLGGDQEYVKPEFFVDWYNPLGSAERSVRNVLFASFAGGVAQPYGDTEFINYSQRFFLGGSVTLRGFRFRGVGPFVQENGVQADYPIGGETYMRGTVEYRFPLYTVAQPGTTDRREMFRGALFFDWGVLDPEPMQLDFDQLRMATGFGFGLAYPIPLTFNFGWPLRDGPGDQLEVFSFRLQLR